MKEDARIKEEFIKAGYWPNSVMYELWRKAWALGMDTERKRCEERCVVLEKQVAVLQKFLNTYAEYHMALRFFG